MVSNCLWVMFDGEDESFILAPTLRDALHQWKEKVAGFINEDYASEGIDRQISAEEITDPESVSLVATPDQLLL